MELDQVLAPFIAGVGGAVLNFFMAFNKRFNTWLDAFSPAQKYYITMALTGTIGALIALAVSCTGILQLIGCNKDIAPQVAMSAFAAVGGNQGVYNGLKAMAKTKQQEITQATAQYKPANPDATGNGGGGYG